MWVVSVEICGDLWRSVEICVRFDESNDRRSESRRVLGFHPCRMCRPCPRLSHLIPVPSGSLFSRRQVVLQGSDKPMDPWRLHTRRRPGEHRKNRKIHDDVTREIIFSSPFFFQAFGESSAASRPRTVKGTVRYHR